MRSCSDTCGLSDRAIQEAWTSDLCTGQNRRLRPEVATFPEWYDGVILKLPITVETEGQ